MSLKLCHGCSQLPALSDCSDGRVPSLVRSRALSSAVCHFHSKKIQQPSPGEQEEGRGTAVLMNSLGESPLGSFDIRVQEGACFKGANWSLAWGHASGRGQGEVQLCSSSVRVCPSLAG